MSQATQLLALARDVAAEAAVLAARMRDEGVDVAATKSSATDVVTRADRASEELIRSRLLAARPDDAVVGEEGDDHAGTSGVRWIVDPIDGTVNYLYGWPWWAVSVAAEVDGQIVAGVVHNPATGEVFSATRGGGAWLGEQRLTVRPAVETGQALIATGFNYEPDVRRDQGTAVAELVARVRDVRRGGSCALDLCYVGAGRVDGYVEEGAHLWDWAAGGLVAQEAGARLEISASGHGKDLIVCAPEESFVTFEALVADCGF